MNNDDFENLKGVIWTIGLLIWAAWEWDVFRSGNIHSMTWKTQVNTETYVINFRPELEFEVDETRNQVFQQIKFPIRGISSEIIGKTREPIENFYRNTGESARNNSPVEPLNLSDEEKGLLEFDRQLTPLETTLTALENCTIKSSDTWRCDSSWGGNLLASSIKSDQPYIGMINGEWVTHPDISEEIYNWKIGVLFERINHGDIEVVSFRTIAEQKRLEDRLRNMLRRNNEPADNY